METRVHISHEVSDLAKSIAFYKALFMQEPTKIPQDYANFRMESPGLHLALVHTPSRLSEAPSNRHYGIELFDEAKLKSWQQAVTSANLSVRIEENVTCCYAVANKFWARDPDGHEWEFWVRSAEADAMHGTEKVVQAVPACCAPGQCC